MARYPTDITNTETLHSSYLYFNDKDVLNYNPELYNPKDPDRYNKFLGMSINGMDRDLIIQSPMPLFYELEKGHHVGANGRRSVYTMYDYDRVIRCPYTDKEIYLISARQVYLNSSTEYSAALKLVGSWTTWQYLLKQKQFYYGQKADVVGSWEGFKEWQNEKQEKDKAEARDYLLQQSKQGSTSAAKTLYEEHKKSVGRPKKGTLDRNGQIEASLSIKEEERNEKKELKEHMKSLGLEIIK